MDQITFVTLTLFVLTGVLAANGLTIGAITNKTTDDWVRDPEVVLPPQMLICRRDVPSKDRNQCIKDSIMSYLPATKQGYPPLGIEPFDPYILPKNRLEFREGELYAKMIMKGTKISGISKAQILNVRSKANSQKLYIELDVRFPKVFVEADYKGRGGYREFKVNSAGHSKMTLIDATGTWKFLGNLQTIENEDYMVIKSLDLANFRVKNMHFDITGLFPDPDVNELALNFLNQVWESVYQQILPQIKSVWEPATLDIVNKIFERVPYRRLMPTE